MKKKILLMTFTMCMVLGGCSNGVSQEEYDKVVAERDEYKEKYEELSNIQDDNNSETSEVTDDSNSTENDLASQMEITEYSYENTIGDTLYFLVVKNNSNETVEISVNATAKDSDGNIIGAADSSENAVASGYEICLCNYFNGVKSVGKFEYTMTVKIDEYYESVVQDISTEESITDDKVILTCTNNGSDAARFVEARALFFKNGELVNTDSTYVTDDDSEIKPGATISKELNCYGDYDDVKVYISGRK